MSVSCGGDGGGWERIGVRSCENENLNADIYIDGAPDRRSHCRSCVFSDNFIENRVVSDMRQEFRFYVACLL